MRKGSGGIPPEEFEKAFGDDFWDRPIEERVDLLLKRMLSVSVDDINKKKRKQKRDEPRD